MLANKQFLGVEEQGSEQAIIADFYREQEA